jgi:hypothetical protein
MCAIHPTKLITLKHLGGTTNYKTPHYAILSNVLYLLPHRSSTLLGTLFLHSVTTVFHTHAKNKRNVQHHVLLQHILCI